MRGNRLVHTMLAGAGVALAAAAGPAYASEIHTAAQSGNIAAVKLLLQKDKRLVNAVDGDGRMPLFYALTRTPDSPELVRLLLDKGANVNRMDTRGDVPLVSATNRRKLDQIRLLLKYHANINAKDPDHGYAALHEALATYPSYQVVKTLIRAGADVNLPDRAGDTPFDIARSWHDPTIMELFPRK